MEEENGEGNRNGGRKWRKKTEKEVVISFLKTFDFKDESLSFLLSYFPFNFYLFIYFYFALKVAVNIWKVKLFQFFKDMGFPKIRVL